MFLSEQVSIPKTPPQASHRTVSRAILTRIVNSPNMLLSASRDKTLIIWNLTRDETQYGYPKRSLHGHSHIVSDCVCSPHAWHLRLRLRPPGRGCEQKQN